MVKDIILNPGHTFSEFSLLPGYTSANCNMNSISLGTNLSELELKIPMLSAAMTSVTGYEMALALGKEGGIGILPARLSVEEQVDIVKRIKSFEMGFVEDPETARENETIEQVLRNIGRHGHSKIPVVDRNNVFLGLFDQQHYWQMDAGPHDTVTKAILPFQDGNIPYCNTPDISVDDARNLLGKKESNYLVVLDEQNRLVKLAFKKDVEKVKVGVAISTYEGWKRAVEENIKAGVDLIVVDTSDAYSIYASDVLNTYKQMGVEVPICMGNIVTYEAAIHLMKEEADMIKIGMSSGSICTTKREKAVGRAPMSALIEVDRARRDWYKKSGRHIPIIMDGGIVTAADMVIALTMADAIMMGGYFNKFYEAAGEKLDANKKVTTDENNMRYVATWGEGSERAQNLQRYGHATRKTFFPEGEEGLVPYCGRLKSTLNRDLQKIKAAMISAGCNNLKEFRKNAVLELNSIIANEIIAKTHDILPR